MTESWGNHVGIVVNGVMKGDNDVAPIIPGLLLYRSLVKTHRVSLIIDESNRMQIQYWLKVNGFIDHTNEVYFEVDDPIDVVERREAQISRLRSTGSFSLLIESDMRVAKRMLETGVPTFLFLRPQYTHPDFDPNAQFEVTPWESILNEQIRQREARANDERLKEFQHDNT
jgi:hypothetical protein